MIIIRGIFSQAGIVIIPIACCGLAIQNLFLQYNLLKYLAGCIWCNVFTVNDTGIFCLKISATSSRLVFYTDMALATDFIAPICGQEFWIDNVLDLSATCGYM